MYVIPDTDVWADFFKHENPEFEELLEQGNILVSHLVIKKSFGPEAVKLLKKLPQAPKLDAPTFEALVAKKNLKKFGLNDYQVSLLATTLAIEAKVWTKDRMLRTIATVFGVCFFERD